MDKDHPKRPASSTADSEPANKSARAVTPPPPAAPAVTSLSTMLKPRLTPEQRITDLEEKLRDAIEKFHDANKRVSDLEDLRKQDQEELGELRRRILQLEEEDLRQRRTLIVGNIPYQATESDMIQLIGRVGPILTFRLATDGETGSEKSRGYGFCEFADPSSAANALLSLNGVEYQGRQLWVDKSKGA